MTVKSDELRLAAISIYIFRLIPFFLYHDYLPVYINVIVVFFIVHFQDRAFSETHLLEVPCLWNS